MTPLINKLIFGKRAEQIRAMGWKPNLVVFDDQGQECELISYPYQDNDVAMIQVRTTVGDPSTMVKKPCSSLFSVLTDELTKRRNERREKEEQKKRDEFDSRVDEGHDGIFG